MTIHKQKPKKENKFLTSIIHQQLRNFEQSQSKNK